jgi:tRNA threonylcarbamoyladenosine biosynthesis protein TsaE
MSNKVSSSPEETHRFGRELATRLRSGDCVALIGDLGSGKTCFVQGICDGLRVTDSVTSPTFVLINEYAGQSPEGSSIPIYHFDLYRLGDPEELYDIGCDDFFYGSGICLIEWADLGGDLIPDHAIEVRFSHVGEMIRNLTLSGG